MTKFSEFFKLKKKSSRTRFCGYICGWGYSIIC